MLGEEASGRVRDDGDLTKNMMMMMVMMMRVSTWNEPDNEAEITTTIGKGNSITMCGGREAEIFKRSKIEKKVKKGSS